MIGRLPFIRRTAVIFARSAFLEIWVHRGCLKLYEICEELSLTCRRAVWDAEGMWKGQYKGIDDWELRETEDFYGNAAA